MEMTTSDRRPFYRQLCAVGLPIAAQFFLTASLNLIDTVMVGRLGERAVAAVGAANQFYYILTFLLTGVTSGCGVFIAQYHGKGDDRLVRHSLGAALLLSQGSILFFLAALLLPEQIAGLFIRERAFMRDTAAYLRIVCFSYPLAGVTAAYSAGMKNVGRAVPAMLTSLAGVLVNIALNDLLIFGHGGFPRLGIRGAAVATLAARCVELAVVLALARRSVFAAPLRALFGFDRRFFRTILQTVRHTVASELVWSVGVSAYAVAYGKLGETALAVAQVYQTLQSFFSILFYGIAGAALQLLGQALGAGRRETARRDGRRMLRLSLLLGVASGVAMGVGARPLAGLFSLPAATADEIVRTLRTLALPFAAFCVNTVVITGILRSGGDTKVPLYIESALIWCGGVPLTFCVCLASAAPVHLAVLATYVWELPKLWLVLRRMRKGAWLQTVAR